MLRFPSLRRVFAPDVLLQEMVKLKAKMCEEFDDDVGATSLLNSLFDEKMNTKAKMRENASETDLSVHAAFASVNG